MDSTISKKEEAELLQKLAIIPIEHRSDFLACFLRQIKNDDDKLHAAREIQLLFLRIDEAKILN
jgi:hypothetical protein